MEVIVVGGGLVGCLCALRLAEAGASVTVIDKGRIGAEASSAAAGILAAQSESRAPGLLFDLAIASRGMYERMAIELRERWNLDIGWTQSGVLETGLNVAEVDALDAQFAWQRASGLRVDRLTAPEVHEREPGLGPWMAGGVAFPDDAQVDPPRVVRAIALAAERAGVRFLSGVHVRRVVIQNEVVRGVETDSAVLPSEQVIVAAGAWSSGVQGAQIARSAVRPARGQIVEVALSTPPVSHVVFGAGGYVVPRPDGRVACGSTLEFVGFRNEVTVDAVQAILRTATTLVPSLAGAVMTRTWANFRPNTPDSMPLVGDGGVRGLTIATGHGRSGILMAPITAVLVRDRVCGRPSQWDLSAVDPRRDALRGVPGSDS